MANSSSFAVFYDADSDVLYISKRDEAAVRASEDRFGIVWRYDRQGELLGATVLDFHDRWAEHELQLANELSRRFGIPARQAMTVLDHAMEQRRA